jgi:hypothetical protein
MRGDHAMGFSHLTAVHHFKLLPDGGVIEVDVKDAQDTATRDQIRAHLAHVASMFGANDFDVPMFIHDTVPPGVAVMKEKHGSIAYAFQPTALGGEVRIRSQDSGAIGAIHQFLAFQIQDHRTGDSESVTSEH